jgi:hypothetical protein
MNLLESVQDAVGLGIQGRYEMMDIMENSR